MIHYTKINGALIGFRLLGGARVMPAGFRHDQEFVPCRAHPHSNRNKVMTCQKK